MTAVRDLTPQELKYVDRDVLASWVEALQKERAQLAAGTAKPEGKDAVDVPLVRVGVIDVARPYLREAFGGPEHDYRLHAATPTGGRVTFHWGATADDVHAYWTREGWLGGEPR